MTTPPLKFTSINEYHANYTGAALQRLEEIRAAIREAAPHAKEEISYNMPAFRQHGVLVYYAAYKAHIGFYPTGGGIQAFQNEFGSYKYSKGAVQFPINEPIPVALVQKIVRFRIEEDAEAAALKAQKKKPGKQSKH